VSKVIAEDATGAQALRDVTVRWDGHPQDPLAQRPVLQNPPPPTGEGSPGVTRGGGRRRSSARL